MAKFFGSMNLKTRVLAVVLLLIVAGIWGLALRVSSVVQQDLQQILGRQLEITAKYVAADIDDNLQVRIDILKSIAATIDQNMLEQPAKIQLLLEQRSVSPRLFPRGVLVANDKGTIIADAPHMNQRINGYIGDRKYFRDTMSTREVVISIPIISRFSHQAIILISIPLLDKTGAAIGILFTSISPLDTNLFNFRNQPNLGEIVKIVVVSRESRLTVSASSDAQIMKPLPAKGINPMLDARIARQLTGVGVTRTSYGKEALNIHQDLSTTDWMVIAGVNTDHAFAPIKTMQREIYFTAFLLSLIILILLRYFLKRQLAPLEDAAQSIQRMSEASAPLLPLLVQYDDEVGRLASNFNLLVTERNRLHAELEESEATLRKAHSVANIGSWKLDISTKKLIWSEQAYKIFDVPADTEMTLKTFIACIFPEDRDAVVNAWNEALNGKPCDIEHRINSSGPVRWARQRIEVTLDPEGNPLIGIGTVQEITRSKLSEAHIEFLAYHDALTKLPNRMLAKDRLDLAMAYADRSENKVAMLFIDLDNFKSINDSLGHLVGDSVLKAVATRLRNCVRDTETICRQGGDEFLAILSDVRDVESASNVTKKILEQMALPFDIDGLELVVTLSIGVAIYPDDGKDFSVLLKKADTAMYHAKEAGRNTYRFYTEKMNVDTLAHLNTVNGLRHALEHNEFVLHYQPQIDLATDTIVGVEALIRWNHPKLGLLPAAYIIPIAEASGLIIPIGEWVLKEACRQAMAWRKMGLPEFVMAINLSAVQFKRGDVEKSVTEALDESGLPPEMLELELTESILIQDSDTMLASVRRLKSIGVKLSIDDFGTGYSSLSYLKRFAVDKLKIDQSFIRDLNSDPESAVIVRAIIQMARSLSLKTIAEGVEQEHITHVLRLLQCDEVQGAYFAMPMPEAEFVQYLTAMHENA